jgi:nucleotide-binding universal stress UspA family protein
MLFAPHILFPVDFSERSKAVRPHVISLAEHFHAKVTLIHVIQIPIGWYGGMEQAFPVLFDVSAMIADGKRQLEQFFGSPPGLTVEAVVEHGDPASRITDYAEQHAIGLIMMPTHGCGKFRSLLLGSVTAKVLHDAKCPVWTATHTEEPDLADHAKYRTILCAAGLEPENVGVIRYAGHWARSFKAQLRLVHAVWTADIPREKYLDVGFHEAMIHVSREKLDALQREAGTDAELCLQIGSVSSVVREATLAHDADLVVIGRGRLHETLGRLRTNAYAIVRDSLCPVLKCLAIAKKEMHI